MDGNRYSSEVIKQFTSLSLPSLCLFHHFSAHSSEIGDDKIATWPDIPKVLCYTFHLIQFEPLEMFQLSLKDTISKGDLEGIVVNGLSR